MLLERLSALTLKATLRSLGHMLWLMENHRYF